jgi:hypothetical protein
MGNGGVVIGLHVLLPEDEQGAKGVGMVSPPALIHTEEVGVLSVFGSEENEPLFHADVSHLGMHGREQRIEGESRHERSNCECRQTRRLLFQAQTQVPADFQEPRKTGQ